ncbi:MAG: sulfatase [Planctomycetaceae bacterium]
MPRHLFFHLASILIAAALFPAPTPAAEAGRPNVLFIAVDDLNDWIGCLGGHPDCKSPNIDALAKRGVLFTRSYCAAPACNPSRAALMTGVRPWDSGVYVNPQPWRPAMPDVVTLPQHLMKAGYDAVGCGKIFHGRYDDDASWRTYLKKGRDPRPTRKVLADPRSSSGGIKWGVLDGPDSAMNDYKMVSYAIDYLKKTHDKPFFLACGIFRPHMPWQVPRKYYDMYPPDKIRLPKVLDTDLADVPRAGKRMAKPQGDHAKMLKTGNWRYAVQAYLASISFADAQVGRLLKALDASPHAKNTIVVLWGDHGWHLGEKQHWRKFALWEEATRTPLMIAAPGITKPGSVCRRTVDFMSVYPTLAELCGTKIPKHCKGPSFVSLLKDPKSKWGRPAVTTHGRGNHAVRSERFRYIRYANGDEELYDHDSDPLEWKNLAGEPKFAVVKRKLARWLPKKEAPNAKFDRRIRRGKKNKKKKRRKKKAA